MSHNFTQVYSERDRAAYADYVAWCQRLSHIPSPIDIYLNVTKGLGMGVISWTGTK
jgi:hypothetical protein